jgi:hypothetical protein
MVMKLAQKALAPARISIEGRYSARERAQRIDLGQDEEQIREQIIDEIEAACRGTDTSLVWDAMSALRIAEQQCVVMAGLAKINSTKTERLERDVRRASAKKRKSRPDLRPVPKPEE